MNLYLQRLVIDHDSHPQQLRKPVSFKDAVKVHQACGAYLFFLAKIQQIAPENQFEAIRTDLFIQFKAGLLDPDLLHIVESQVPANADIKAVSAFRLAVAKSTGDMTYLLYFLQHSFDAQFESWTSIFSTCKITLCQVHLYYYAFSTKGRNGTPSPC